MSGTVESTSGVGKIGTVPLPITQSPRVFLSYSHDDDEHEDRVLNFSERLRADGIDARIDQYSPWPEEGWPRWMERQIRDADFVLLVCTPTYRRRVTNEEQPPLGRGVCWEAMLIYNELYAAKSVSSKFLPVLFGGVDEDEIPRPLAGHPIFHISTEEGYVDLVRRLTNQPRVVPGEIGKMRLLAPVPALRTEVRAAPGAHASTGTARKIFISYSHAEPEEENLARHLFTRLSSLGHDVFIDLSIAAGTEWSRELGSRIAWCDHLVVLLSPSSMLSEMVQSEVRSAHYIQKRNGGPKIIPVRVRFTGPLAYELAIYLDHLQYILWSGEEDSESVVEGILRALERSPDAPAAAIAGPGVGAGNGAHASSPSRPRAQIDARSAAVPGGQISSDDPYYIDRKADGIVAKLALQDARTLVIKGPRQVGKSSLLLHYLIHCQKAEKAIAFVDFSIFSNEDMAEYTEFLARLATAIQQMLQIESGDPGRIASQFDMINFVERHVLGVLDQPVVIAFDEVDRVSGRPYQDDFFTMLRAWVNASRSPLRRKWQKLSLALVISTEPALLITEADRSPFNVGVVEDLRPFDRAQHEELCRRHACDVDEERLWVLLRGHPYLTRLAFYRLSDEAMTQDELFRSAPKERGPFGDHLRALLVKLHENPRLLDALKEVISTGTIPSEDDYYRLYAAGLVCREDRRVDPANMLYAQYFRGVC